MLNNQPNHIIAIGASAGGLQDINSFFDNTPSDGVAYVVIQHLSPDFKSQMVQMLAKHSKLFVREAAEQMKVKANEVYLIPNDKYLTIKNDRFHLTDKQFVKGPHLTVNEFFNSLASNSGKQAVGVILSGLGADGTEGAKAIKNAGGMIIARNPDTAEFGSMPTNAIATGLVDYVLEPEAMPATISSYLVQQENNLENTKEDDKNLAIILNILKDNSPLDFTEYRHSTILRRIKRRAAENNFTTLTAYIELLKIKPEEVEALMQDFLISVTSFFRGKDPFDYLENEIIPALLKKLEPNEEIKIWVAGCATGEEAYSFAILLAEQLTGDLKNRVVKIFATDIDSPALAFAGKGVYPESIEKDVTASRLQKYFIKVANFYTIKPAIRKMVIFAQHDIGKNPPYLNMLLISCRNLLIYMTPTLQKKVYLTLLFGLKKDGYLFLGSSENPIPILSNLEVVSNQWKIYRNLETKRPFRFDTFTLPVLTDKKIEQVTHHYTAADEYNNLSDTVNNLQATAHNQLIVCIDGNNKVIKSFGDTTKYLLQKNFTSNLADLLPKPMALAFNIISANVLKNGEKQTVQGIIIKKGDAIIKVSLAVTAIQIKKSMPQLLMVTFSEDAPANNNENDAILFDEKLYINQYTHNIEEELNELKNKLKVAHSQLDAGNENMQSFNEELLSANEEMQSTNEELQSVNEELHTVNTDYQLKNKELLAMNDDLNNYFRSNINGQLFVNKELQLMKFSPGTVKQINLVPTDIGRPLSNITTNIKFETIIDDIKEVIRDGYIITKEIETGNGMWYQVMTMPYIQADNTRNGAIITFNDISELKQTKLEVDKKNIELEEFAIVASHDLKEPLRMIHSFMLLLRKNYWEQMDEKAKRYIDFAVDGSSRMSVMINELLDYARMGSDGAQKELTDTNQLLREVLALQKVVLEEKKAIVEVGTLPNIVCVKTAIGLVFQNLIGNAIKFQAPGIIPFIKITGKEIDSNYLFSVEDNGIGIAESDQEKIFKLFKKLHGQTNFAGIGMGLANCEKIIKQHGGTIWVQSAEGKGSVFWFTIKKFSI